uniref:RING-type domain-containing protein n=1 Tax=Alexandrium catenella TaxID=2925 RepID=A0A7S1LEX4_ALECA
MGLSDDYLVNPGSVSSALRCGICHEVYEDPVFCDGGHCQHVFCRACLEQALKLKASCPTCKAAVEPSQVQPHMMGRSLLDELLVHCRGGCNWTGRLDAHLTHLLACPVQRLTEQLAAANARVKERDVQLAARDREIAWLRANAAKFQRRRWEVAKYVTEQRRQLDAHRDRLDLLAELAGSADEEEEEEDEEGEEADDPFELAEVAGTADEEAIEEAILDPFELMGTLDPFELMGGAFQPTTPSSD